MRHRLTHRRLGVPANRRTAMLKQLVESLLLHGRIKTTLARAKETRPLAEHMVTLAKKGSLHHRRQALSYISRNDVVHRLFDHIVEWYADRSGGYTRIIKIGPRRGDAAPMAFLELLDWIPGEKLVGQNTKVVKSETGEETPDGKGEKDKKAKAKAKKKETKKAKAEPAKPVKKKVTRDAEKEKKISERLTEKEKLKKERAAAREKAKKAKGDKKPQAAPKAKKAVAKPKVKKVKKAKKK